MKSNKKLLVNGILIMILFSILFVFPLVLAEDIAYILKNPSYPNAEITNAVRDLGLSVKLIDSDTLTATTSFSNYSMILVGDENFGTKAVYIPVNKKNTLFMNTYHIDEWSWANDISQLTSSQKIEVKNVNRTHVITKNISQIFAVYTACCGVNYPLYYLSRNNKALKLQNIISPNINGLNNLDGVVTIAIPGTQLKNSVISNARGLFFGITETKYWTAESKLLFKNSVKWVLNGDGAPSIIIGIPSVTLISPANGSIIGINRVNFNYTAIDSTSSYLNCTLYSNLIGNFSALITNQIRNGTYSSFYANDVDNGVYIWNIKCSNGVNSSFALQNRTFTVNVTNATINHPPVLGSLPTLNINEDTGTSLILNAIDVDGDSLLFSVVYENTSQVDCIVNGNNLSVVPATNWFGAAKCTIKVDDRRGGIDTGNLTINVAPINDAPTFTGTISNQQWNENSNKTNAIDLKNYFRDIDNSSLVYSVSGNANIIITIINGVVSFYSPVNWYGVEYAVFTASDGSSNVKSNNITLTVAHTNKPPILNPIPDFEIEEDSRFHLVWNLTASDIDGFIVRYDVVNENTNKVDCTVSDALLGIKPAKDFYGIESESASCTIQVTDNQGGTDRKTFKINVTNVNDAPVIKNHSPAFNPIIPEDGSQTFSIIWNDIDNTPAEVSVIWYVDGINVSIGYIGDSYTYQATGEGLHVIKVVVKDLGDLNDSYEWSLLATRIPIASLYSCNTTIFANMTESDLSAVKLILEKCAYGKIEFIDLVDLRNQVDFDNYADIQQGLVAIDTNYFTTLRNKPSIVSLYNIISDKTPTIYHNTAFNLNRNQINTICPSTICSNISYNKDTKILTFVANSFSTFKIGETATCSQQGGDICSSDEKCDGPLIGASDSNNCCSISCVKKPITFKDIDECRNITPELEINIKEPDEGDDFEIGDSINAELKIKNNANEDLDTEITAYLYDITEDEIVEEASESVDIDEHDSETINLELKIPSNADEDDDYAIVVKAEGDNDNDYCNQEHINIDVKRKKYDAIVRELRISPEVVKCERNADIDVKVQNIGSKDLDDVYVEIENLNLNLDKKSEKFELEKHNKDDEARVSFVIELPENISEGEYPIKTTVHFNDEEDSVFANLIVEKCKEGEVDIIVLSPTEAEAQVIELKQTGTVIYKKVEKPKVTATQEYVSKTTGAGVSDYIVIYIAKQSILIIIDLLLAIGIITILIYLICRRR